MANMSDVYMHQLIEPGSMSELSVGSAENGMI